MNEELRAATEEAQSANEELQSTNEELETAKEELQATNEELTTVNEELHSRNTLLSQLSSDLTNLLAQHPRPDPHGERRSPAPEHDAGGRAGSPDSPERRRPADLGSSG